MMNVHIDLFILYLIAHLNTSRIVIAIEGVVLYVILGDCTSNKPQIKPHKLRHFQGVYNSDCVGRYKQLINQDASIYLGRLFLYVRYDYLLKY